MIVQNYIQIIHVRLMDSKLKGIVALIIIIGIILRCMISQNSTNLEGAISVLQSKANLRSRLGLLKPKNVCHSEENSTIETRAAIGCPDQVVVFHQVIGKLLRNTSLREIMRLCHNKLLLCQKELLIISLSTAV